MQGIKQIAILVRRAEDLLEGSRSALGLAVENFGATLFILDMAVDMTAALKENLDWFAEMECEVFSNNRANTESHGIPFLSLEEMGARLRAMDLIIPFGNA